MRQGFNYSQWKEAILMLLMVLLMMYFSSQREVQKTQALLLKGCFLHFFLINCCLAIICDKEITVFEI